MADRVDVEKIVKEFQSAKTDDGQILLEYYLKGYSEITLFFDLLGTAFGFVGKDLRDKCRILTSHMIEQPEEFTSIQTMVSYEVENNLTKKTTSSGLLSGSRTLLRLHRALDFFVKFIGRLKDLPVDGKTSTIASETYAETLAKYHLWIIKQAGYLAIKTLPNKGDFIHRYVKQDVDALLEMADSTVAAMKDVYDITQALYAQHDLLELA